MRLAVKTLGRLDPRIAVPRTDRAAQRPGILHIGLGNFHRAHQAIAIDDLMAEGQALDWAILGAGVMPSDAAMRRDLQGQDWLYTVVEQDAAQEAVRVVGAMAGFVPVADDHGPLLQALRDPAIRIVSLTVTEGGYFMAAGSDALDAEHPAIIADIAAPDRPRTVFGVLVAALRHRRAAGERPFTVMSCDNVPHNGDVTRSVAQGIAAGQDPGLAAWIADTVTFPNAMVDRITPATTDARRAHLRQAYGLEDARPVFCEPFRQWVLEDRFTAGRPPLEAAGVTFVDDVTPYETMKIRILNGGHALIAYPAGLLGITFVHDAMAHPLIAAFLDRVEREEILPVVPPVPGTSLGAYHTLIRDRFANPRVEDTVRRLCLDGSNRQPKFIVPSIRDNLATGGPIDGLALASALWCRYCAGRDEAGGEIAPNDPNWDRLTRQAAAARETPAVWLDMADVYGDLAASDRFRSRFGTALTALYEQGTEAVLHAYLGGRTG